MKIRLINMHCKMSSGNAIYITGQVNTNLRRPETKHKDTMGKLMHPEILSYLLAYKIHFGNFSMQHIST